MTTASLGSSIFARYRIRLAAPTMPNARARLAPTISITHAPTTASTICVWITGDDRAGVPLRRGRNASAAPSAVAQGRAASALQIIAA